MGGKIAEHPVPSLRGMATMLGVSSTGAIVQGRPMLPVKGAMTAGDVLLGPAYNECHSNGFTLIRKIIYRPVLSYRDEAPWTTG